MNTVESHCLLCIPTVIRFSRIFAWRMYEILGKYETEVNKMGQNNPYFLKGLTAGTCTCTDLSFSEFKPGQ